MQRDEKLTGQRGIQRRRSSLSELVIARDMSLTAQEAAARLGRSVAAVNSKRYDQAGRPRRERRRTGPDDVPNEVAQRIEGP